MAHRIHRLKPLFVQKTKKPGTYADGGNLYLLVGSEGRRSWLFIYRYNGRRREIGLGGTVSVSLPEARKTAAALREVLARGGEPKAHRDEQKLALALKNARSVSFKECAEKYIDEHRGEWKGRKNAGIWSSTLATYAYPAIGKTIVADVTSDAVLRILRPIWNTKPELASKLRGRIAKILDYAKASNLRKGDNPAEWKGNLQFKLAARKGARAPGHFRALHYREVPELVAALEEQKSTAALCLRFALLTAARTGEVVGAKWDEIDLEGRVWAVPADRMKMGREHRVPLSRQAVEVLKEIPRMGSHVFPGNGKKAPQAGGPPPLSNMAMLSLLRRIEWNGRTTTHGLRSAFKTWASERTSYADEISEAALAHAKGDKLAAAYNRGDVLEKRRRLMQDWGSYCDKGGQAGARVISIRG
jgi:integrase